MWIGRFAVFKNRYKFIHSRLTRTVRDEIPRFRFDFKHVSRDIGDHVHASLVRSFITEYLEPDGYFFIRMLTVNVSDFVVQEIIEQLWTCYVLKYGEKDAKNAEDLYYRFRDHPEQSKISIKSTRSLFSDNNTASSNASDPRRDRPKKTTDDNQQLLTFDKQLETIQKSISMRNENV
jgi:hypothetical protein